MAKNRTITENNSLRLGHSYIARNGDYSIGIEVKYNPRENNYTALTFVATHGRVVKTEAKETEENPIQDLTLYGLNLKLADEIKKIEGNAGYLARESILSKILKSNNPESELEQKTIGQDTTGKVTGNTLTYRMERYDDYWLKQQKRAKRTSENRNAPEPPMGDPHIFARDSLLCSLPGHKGYNFIGTVGYESPQRESTIRSLNNSPASRLPQRKNPHSKPGMFALASQAYAKATGSYSPTGDNPTNVKSSWR